MSIEWKFWTVGKWRARAKLAEDMLAQVNQDYHRSRSELAERIFKLEEARAKQELEGKKIVVKTVEVSETSIVEWRRTKINVEESRRVLADPVVKMMIQLLEQESPAMRNVLGRDTQAVDIARCYGENVGYLHCLEQLKSFGRLIEDQRVPEETFESE